MTDIIDLSHMRDTLMQQADDDQIPVVHFQHGISIIVVLDKAGIPFLRSLPTLLPQKLLREVIIVDRGCPTEVAGVLQKIAKEMPVLRFFASKGHLTKTQCYNFAAKRAHGRYLLFTEQHAILPKDTSVKLLFGLSGKPDKPTIVSANLEGLGEPLKADNPLLDPKESTLSLLGLAKASLNDNPVYGYASHVSSIPSGCFLIERSHFWLSDGFDAQLGQASLTDLCLKMHLQGGGVYQVSDLKVRLYPKCRGVSDSPIKESLQWIKYYAKHYKKSPTRRWLYPLTILLFMRGVLGKIKSLFTSNKQQPAQEPSLEELLKRKSVTQRS